MAQLDAEILDTLVKAAENGGGAQTVDITKADVTQNDLAASRIALGDIIADNESIIDAKTLGVDATRQMVILSPKAYFRYINSFDTNVLAQSEEIKVGNLAVRQINGAMIIKHPLIGKKLAAGVLHKTKAYDFSINKTGGKPLEGIVVTDIAAAIPFSLNNTAQRVNGWGNTEIIMRYVYGKGAIRPGLIKTIVGK